MFCAMQVTTGSHAAALPACEEPAGVALCFFMRRALPRRASGRQRHTSQMLNAPLLSTRGHLFLQLITRSPVYFVNYRDKSILFCSKYQLRRRSHVLVPELCMISERQMLCTTAEDQRRGKNPSLELRSLPFKQHVWGVNCTFQWSNNSQSVLPQNVSIGTEGLSSSTLVFPPLKL